MAIRTDMGTFGSAGDLGVVGQATKLTAEVTTALTAASGQAVTAELAAAAVGDNGTSGFASSGTFDTAVLCLNRNRLRISELKTVYDAAVVRIGELDTKQLKLVTRLKEVEDILENVGLVAKN